MKLTPEEIALFNKLKQHLGAENQKDISLTPKERVLLSEVRDKKEPGWLVEPRIPRLEV